jgi:hypothetical protein
MGQKMSKSTHLGEIEDGKLYTQIRLGQIWTRSPEWVMDNYVFPVDPITKKPIPGVPHDKKGTLFQMSGEAIRLWSEEQARPGLRKPK